MMMMTMMMCDDLMCTQKLTRSQLSLAHSAKVKVGGTEFHHATDDTLQMFKVEGHRSMSQRKVMYQQQNAIIWQWINSATSNLTWRGN